MIRNPFFSGFVYLKVFSCDLVCVCINSLINSVSPFATDSLRILQDTTVYVYITCVLHVPYMYVYISHLHCVGNCDDTQHEEQYRPCCSCHVGCIFHL